MKILSLPVDFGGCGWMRVRQPLHMINQYTESEAHVIDKESDNMIETAEALSVADIIVIRQGGEAGLEGLRKAVQDYGLQVNKKKEITAKIVMDIDDNIELISPYSQHYDEYGVKEFPPIWTKDRKDFDVYKNRARVMSLFRGLAEADLVTVTTPDLFQYALQFNKHVEILPNYVNLDRWWPVPHKDNEQLRIGWSGGISHYEDWYAIKEPLNALMRKYQFKVVMEGAAFTGIFDEDNKHLVEVHEWAPFEGYSYHMMSLMLDIMLVPLADMPFNRYKSSLKFIEWSAMGKPSVVSNITPYKEVLTDGVTGLGYETSDEFYTQLEKLLQSETLRQNLGKNARQMVENRWDARKHAQKWLDAYKSIL